MFNDKIYLFVFSVFFPTFKKLNSLSSSVFLILNSTVNRSATHLQHAMSTFHCVLFDLQEHLRLGSTTFHYAKQIPKFTTSLGGQE